MFKTKMHAKFGDFISADAMDDLIMRLDNFNAGHVTVAVFSDFCGPESLLQRVKEYNTKSMTSSPIHYVPSTHSRLQLFPRISRSKRRPMLMT